MVRSKNNPIISTVICTFNRSELLGNAIQSLIDQTLSKSDYEIVIVDNNSQDGTLNIVKKYQGIFLEPLIICVKETKQGLGFARNTGVKNSRGKYVAFMDDDALAGPNWLESALNLFKHVEPTPFVVGGPIYPFYNSIKPAWFKDEYELRTLGGKPRFLRSFESFSGSNMIFRKDLIEKSLGFDIRVGMTGNRISLGEETALFEKIWKNYGDISKMFYSPDLIVHHLVNQYRMTITYQLKRSFASGQAWFLRREPKSFWEKMRTIVGILVSMGRFSGNALLGLTRHHNIRNYVVEMVSPIVEIIGMLCACFGVYKSIKQRKV